MLQKTGIGKGVLRAKEQGGLMMANKHGTPIEWTHIPGYKGETWNPFVGCAPVGPGCEHCYACRQANRFKDTHPQYEGTVQGGNWTGRVNRAPDARFYAPLRWRDPRAIFVCSMSDFFHEGADEWREFAWHQIYDTPQHLYLILTKRPERIPECLPSFGKKEWPWPNVWLGASVESKVEKWRSDNVLRKIPAALRWLSLEPLLDDLGKLNLDGMSWVVCGGESGPGARPMHPDWARGIRDQCQAAGVPYFFKQWGEWVPRQYGGLETAEFQTAKRETILLSTGVFMERAGKKRAGRLLDGRTWNEFPNI